MKESQPKSVSGPGRFIDRNAGREAALQMIYALEMGGQQPGEVTEWYRISHPMDAEAWRSAQALMNSAASCRERIDQLVQQHAKNWRIERMNAIDRSLLRLAVGEMLTWPDLPKSAVINCALKLAKKFSQPKALTFLHGVLDAIARDLSAGTPSVD